MSINTSWEKFQQKYALSNDQIQQFQDYAQELIAWNKKFNLTAILTIEQIISLHFDDSLALSQFVDLSTIKSIADVGTGAGFPIIPLKIAFPHLKITLIEVSLKRVSFLEHMIKILDMNNVEIYPFDWRLFLRKTHFDIDMVIARASLRPDELIRMYKPSSPYNKAQLVYWASDTWVVSKGEEPYFKKEDEYTVANKKRRLIFFGPPNVESKKAS